jgi:hypothetical protein
MVRTDEQHTLNSTLGFTGLRIIRTLVVPIFSGGQGVSQPWCIDYSHSSISQNKVGQCRSFYYFLCPQRQECRSGSYKLWNILISIVKDYLEMWIVPGGYGTAVLWTKFRPIDLIEKSMFKVSLGCSGWSSNSRSVVDLNFYQPFEFTTKKWALKKFLQLRWSFCL